MAVTDLSGNGTGGDIGGATRPAWPLWHALTDGEGTPVPWPGGAGTVIVAGTLGGGTVNIKSAFIGKAPRTKLVVDNVDQLNITAPGTYDFRMAACDLIPTLTGSSSPDVSVAIGGYDL